MLVRGKNRYVRLIAILQTVVCMKQIKERLQKETFRKSATMSRWIVCWRDTI